MLANSSRRSPIARYSPTRIPPLYVLLAAIVALFIIMFVISPLWSGSASNVLTDETFLDREIDLHRNNVRSDSQWRITPLYRHNKPSVPLLSLVRTSITESSSSSSSSSSSAAAASSSRDTSLSSSMIDISYELPVVSLPPVPSQASSTPCRVFVFTMDSLKSREEERLRGGAGGEHFVRTRLQDELITLGCTINIADSDHSMDMAVQDASLHGGMGAVYRWIIMDQWTAISPQLQLRSWLHGIEDRLRITAFFGQGGAHEQAALARIPLNQWITPYPNSVNTFVGYSLTNPHTKQSSKSSQPIGIIWGKEMRYLTDHEALLSRLINDLGVTLVATVANSHDASFWTRTRIDNRGHQTSKDYEDLLDSASFFIGLGDPLAGPSALVAIQHGAVYINPLMERTQDLVKWKSQHDFALQYLPKPYSCGAHLSKWDEVSECVTFAINRAAGNIAAHAPNSNNDDDVQHGDLSYVHPLQRPHNFAARVARLFPIN